MQSTAKPLPPKSNEPVMLEDDRWNRIEEKIKAISVDDDLEQLKARLCSEIAAARAEGRQERRKIAALLELDLPGGETGSQESGYTLDPLTGLPARAYAEAELSRIHAEPEERHVALFLVKRLALINAKFGYSRGDQVLMKVVTNLAQSLPEFKSLFRWAPCAFLVVTPPGLAFKELRSKVHVIEITRMTPVLEWEGRSAMVPVTLDCRILSLKDFETPSDLFLRLDTLAADS